MNKPTDPNTEMMRQQRDAIRSDLPFLREKAEWYKLQYEIKKYEKKLVPLMKVIQLKLNQMKYKRLAKKAMRRKHV